MVLGVDSAWDKMVIYSLTRPQQSCTIPPKIPAQSVCKNTSELLGAKQRRALEG